MQAKLYGSIADLTDSFDLATDGSIKTNVKNYTLATRIGKISDRTVQRENKGLFKWLINSLKSLIGLNVAQLNEMKPDANLDRSVNLVLLDLGYDGKNIISGSYLSTLAGASDARAAIMGSISNAIKSKTPLTAFRKQFRTLVVAPGGLGVLEKHYHRWSGTLYRQVDRNSHVLMAQNLGLKYMLWSHTIKDTSTEICRARSGLVYTIAFIKTWDAEDWPGKIGSFLNYGHGHGCRGHWNAMSNELGRKFEKEGKVNVFN